MILLRLASHNSLMSRAIRQGFTSSFTSHCAVGTSRTAVAPAAVCGSRWCSASSAIEHEHHHLHHDNASQQDHQQHLMLILGKPGGGKGTISGKILKDFPSFQHLSTGDVLRDHVRNQTDIGIQAKEHMDKGCLVPDELMIRLVLDGIDSIHNDSTSNSNKSLLLDGFPRTYEQAVALDESLNVDLVINLDIPTQTIVDRIAERWIHPASGRVYNCSYNPPKVFRKDDITGEDLIQRVDDQQDTVRKRLEKYEKVTAPLVQYYQDKGVLKTFHGTMSDVIYPEVQVWLQDQLLAEKEQ